MCGIIAIKRFDGGRASKPFFKKYVNQKERGQEGFGVITLRGGIIKSYEKSEDEPTMRGFIAKCQEEEILFHHRNPTSTPNFWECAHPLIVAHPSLKHDYFVLHNGVIREPEKMKPEHDRLGFKYLTEIRQIWKSVNGAERETEKKWNDSETFAIELARDIDGEQKGLAHISGSIAFVALQVEKNTNVATKLFWGRNTGSPLYFTQTDNMFSITSAGKGLEVEMHDLHSYDYATNKIEKKGNYVCGYNTSAYAGSYSRSDHEYGGYWGGREWDETSSSWIEKKQSSLLPPKKEHVGFAAPEPIIEVAKSNIITEDDVDEYLDIQAQLAKVEQSLKKGAHDMDMQDYLEEHARNLRDSLQTLRNRNALPIA